MLSRCTPRGVLGKFPRWNNQNIGLFHNQLALINRVRWLVSDATRATEKSDSKASLAHGIASAERESQTSTNKKNGFKGKSFLIAAGLLVAGGYVFSRSQRLEALAKTEQKIASAANAGKVDYHQVAKDIADLLDSDEYDDGSYGPILVRLAWHACGTFSKLDQSGGSWGGTMRFKQEASDGDNAGLHVGRELLGKIHAKHPGISHGDLWTLAGVVAIKEMGGPSIPWRPGRVDQASEKACPPNGRLPDASRDQKHVRDVFYRMGFSDKEIVALCGAHALGRCHTDRSGFEGPWTFSPTMLTNDYYKLLLSEQWVKRDWEGPLQYQDKATRSLMMLPTDMALVWDDKFKAYTVDFANDQEKFFKEFAAAFGKLLELGCEFPRDTQAIIL